MLMQSIDAIEAEVLPCGALIFTSLELTVIALARSEKGRTSASRSHLARALFKIDECTTGKQANWALADARLEALRAFVNSLHRHGPEVLQETQTLQEAGFSGAQETWLRSECARPLSPAAQI